MGFSGLTKVILSLRSRRMSMGLSGLTKVILSLRSRRKHKAWGASPRTDMEIMIEPAKRAAAAESSTLSPISWAQRNSTLRSWGLRPRLYAYACFAG